MTFFSKRKRKNDHSPRFPAWIIVLVAIGLVVIIAILFQPTNRGTGESSVQQVMPTFDDPIELTATYIIQRATAMAQGTPQLIQSGTFDPILLTATAIVQEATNIARGTPQPPQSGSNTVGSQTLYPLDITASAVVEQVTEQARTPGS